MVTGVDNPVGARAARLLTSGGGEVRVFVRATPDATDRGGRLADTYRDLGCKVAHGALDDEAHVETALEQVHTVLHLLGRPTDDPGAYLEATATVISAAIGAGCRRLVLLSDLGVSDPAANPWLDALAEAEDMAADAPLESVVLRCAVIHGPEDPQTTALATGELGDDPPGAHWPVASVDVAATAVLADAQRDLDTGLHVVVALTGPERMETAELARRLADLVSADAGERLPAHAAELLTRVVERPDDALGAGGRAVEEGW